MPQEYTFPDTLSLHYAGAYVNDLVAKEIERGVCVCVCGWVGVGVGVGVGLGVGVGV